MELSQRFSFITWLTQLASHCTKADAGVVWHALYRECVIRPQSEGCPRICFTFSGSSQAWRTFVPHPSLLVIKQNSLLLRPFLLKGWKVEIETMWHLGASLAHFLWTNFFSSFQSRYLWLLPFPVLWHSKHGLWILNYCDASLNRYEIT